MKVRGHVGDDRTDGRLTLQPILTKIACDGMDWS